MKKHFIALCLLFILTIVLVACGSSDTSTGSSDTSTGSSGSDSDSDKKITIKIAHSSPAINDRAELSLQVFKKAVEERSEGRIVIETYPGSQLGGERELLEGVQMGSIEMANLSTGPFPGIFPKIMAFDLPYLFKTTDVAYEVLDGPIGDEIRQSMLDETGIRAVAWGENGFRHFTNKDYAIVKPSDLENLKIRTMENPAHMEMVEALGGSASPLAFGELYSALQQGVMDGQENPVSLIESMRFYEVQNFVTLDGHVYNPHILIINEDFFQGLPEDLRIIIEEEAKAWTPVNRQMNFDQEAVGIDNLKGYGMEITELTPEQKQAFQDATVPVYDMIKKEIGEELYNKMLDAVKEAEKKHL